MKPISARLPIALVFLIGLTAGPHAASGQTVSCSPAQNPDYPNPAFQEATSEHPAAQIKLVTVPASPTVADSGVDAEREGPLTASPNEGRSAALVLNPASSEIVPAAGMASGPGMEAVVETPESGTGMGTASGMGFVPDRPAVHPNVRPFSRIAFAAKMGTMGAGFEVAVPLSRRTNLRSTGNIFSYSHTFSQDGVSYTGTISLRSMQTTLDWFPFRGGFHISPGFFAYGGNNVKAHAAVPGGQTFTLNSTDYRSSLIDPINGSGKITVGNAGPGLTLGWGNLLPRNGRHFSFPFEIGAVYEGAPKIALQLGGSACDSTGAFCSSVASDPSFQQNLIDEQAKLNKDVEPYKFYPIISFGIAVNFSTGGR